jgi:RNA polymerase sigma factor (sigma-70 family)
MASLFGLGAAGSLTDGQLLGLFAGEIGTGSELAFAALIDRHGAMVLATCRSVLRDEHDARDACQATFMVLARKARSLGDGGTIAPWLHRVATRAARDSRSMIARRRGHERSAAARNPEAASPSCGLGPDAGVVHEEIARLPERYRGPIVLCELEGHPLEHAARSLGCPVGTVKSRLSRGRTILRCRLTARGLDPTRSLVVAIGLGRAALPAEIAGELARAGGLVRAGLGLAAGIVPVASFETSASVLGGSYMISMKTLLATVVAAAMVAVGVVMGGGQRAGDPKASGRPAIVSEAKKKDAQGGGRTVRQLADARVAMARKTIAGLETVLLELRKDGPGGPPNNEPEVTVWRRRIAETRHEMGGAEADIIADLTEYHEYARKLLDDARLEGGPSRKAIESLDGILATIEEAEYRVLEAESWLAQARGKAD